MGKEISIETLKKFFKRMGIDEASDDAKTAKGLRGKYRLEDVDEKSPKWYYTGVTYSPEVDEELEKIPVSNG